MVVAVGDVNVKHGDVWIREELKEDANPGGERPC